MEDGKRKTENGAEELKNRRTEEPKNRRTEEPKSGGVGWSGFTGSLCFSGTSLPVKHSPYFSPPPTAVSPFAQLFGLVKTVVGVSDILFG